MSDMKRLEKIMSIIDDIISDISNDDDCKDYEEKKSEALSGKITISKEQLLDAMATECAKVHEVFNDTHAGLLFSMLMPLFCANVMKNVFENNKNEKEEK